MTAEQIDALRTWLYPFGFLSSIAFGLRFLIQWCRSEQAGRSLVPRSFWVLSCIGNALVTIHSLIQLHFPIYLLQSQQFILAWRNLNIMGSNPWPLKRVVRLLIGGAIVATLLFGLQAAILPCASFGWVRSPKVFTSSPEVGFWMHFVGCCGILAFSFRFWLQWWEAERRKVSLLSVRFWWISIIGTVTAGIYFFLLSDWVNLVGPLCSIIPYTRNLVLLRREQKKQRCDIAILAGEVSGDLLGGAAAKALLAQIPSLQLAGVAGPSMRHQGVVPWLRSESFEVMGFVDILRKAPFLLLAIHRVVHTILRDCPSVVVFIDQPSLSITVARRLRAKGFSGKLILVVAPTVWAYRSERSDTVADLFDHILPLYRFEKDFFHHKLPTTWIGHPACGLLKSEEDSKPKKTTLAIFPGSRPGEIRRNLPLQLRAAKLLLVDHPEMSISISSCGSSERLIAKTAAALLDVPFEIVDFSERYALMGRSQAAIAKSGTVTLELALMNIPTVCCYQTGRLTRWWAKKMLRLRPRFFALPNILTGQEIFPECILPPITPSSLANALRPYLQGTKNLPEDLTERLRFQIDSGEEPGELIARTVLTTMGTPQ
jgi:lipid-A-disaccharide synthase